MADFGKVNREFFGEYIHPNLGADRDDVMLESQHGVGFGAIEHPEIDHFWGTVEKFMDEQAELGHS